MDIVEGRGAVLVGLLSVDNLAGVLANDDGSDFWAHFGLLN